MVVTATYSDGSKAAVTGYTVSPSGALATSHTSVTISYTENGVTKTATQAITVNSTGGGNNNNNNNNNNGNGGGSSGGNNSPRPVTPTAPPTPTPATPTPATPTPTPVTIPGNGGTKTTDGEKVDVPISVGTEQEAGSVTVNLDTQTTQNLINDALTAAEKQLADAIAEAESKGETPPADDSVTPVVTLDLSAVPEADSAKFDVDAAESFSEAQVAVTVKLPDAEITLQPESLAALAETTDIGTTPVTVEAATVPMRELKGMQAAQVKGYETVINVDVFVGDNKVDVPATISMPYELKANENPNAVCVWYLDDNGNLTKLDAVYDSETGMITFMITHQSYYVVGYDPVALWINRFEDVDTNAWYYDAVAYANYYALFNGDGSGRFAPQDTMTRAMFVTVLWNMENNALSTLQAARFSDVEAGAWYYEAVQWAAENGLLDGIGSITGGVFEPTKPMTRQEMAAVFYNYAVYKGYEIPANRTAPVYGDAAVIDMWAETAAKKLSEAGVFSGEAGNFHPQRNATRAEVAQMFKNFLRFVAGK